MNKLEKYSSVIIYAFFAILLIGGLLLVPDFGVSWDEIAQRRHGLVALDHVSEMLNLGWDRITKYEFATYKDKYYGVLFSATAYGIEQFLGLESFREQYLLRHYMVFLSFWIACIFFYKLAVLRLQNWKWGLLSVALLILSPRIFAHSFFNPKDIILMCACIVGTYTMTRFIQRRTLKYALIHGLVCAIAINTRIVGILIPAFTFLILFIDLIQQAFHTKVSWKKEFVLLVVFTLSTIVLAVLFWPNIWEAPLKYFLAAFAEMSKYPWPGSNLFYGNNLLGTDTRWYYIPSWIVATTPILYSALAIGAAVLVMITSVRNLWIKKRLYSNESQLIDIILLGLFIGPLFIIAYKQSIVYNGWRQMFFVYPPMLLLAIMFFRNCRNWARKYWKRPGTYLVSAFLIVQMTWTGIWMLNNHPWHQVYFSLAAGQNVFENFDMDYWGLGFKQALEEIAEKDHRKEIVISSNCFPGVMNIWFLSEKYDKKFKYSDSRKDSDYFMSNFYFDIERERFNKQYFPYQDLFFMYKIDGQNMIGVYKIDREANLDEEI